MYSYHKPRGLKSRFRSEWQAVHRGAGAKRYGLPYSTSDLRNDYKESDTPDTIVTTFNLNPAFGMPVRVHSVIHCGRYIALCVTCM